MTTLEEQLLNTSTPARPGQQLGAKSPLQKEKERVAGAVSSEAHGLKLSLLTGKEDVAAKEKNHVPVMVSVLPPQGKERTPADVCCVVDISGSMESMASVQDEAGKSESHGLNLLDVVKHAVRTVIHTLSASDRLCIVAFDHQAEVSLPITIMDKAGKKSAEDALEKLHPRGATDLWAGLKKGLETLKARGENCPRFASVLLLTDGQPNNKPPEGELKALQALRAGTGMNGRLPAVVNTFGFGYNLDSVLLRELAEEGDGSYAFIPDSGFVGTTFVHALSNLLVTFAREAVLQLEPLNGAKLVVAEQEEDKKNLPRTLAEHPVVGGVEGASEGRGPVRLRLGALQHGQSRDLVVRMAFPEGAFLPDAFSKAPGLLKATLVFEPVAAEAVVAIVGPEALAAETTVKKQLERVTESLGNMLRLPVTSRRPLPSVSVEATLSGGPGVGDDGAEKVAAADCRLAFVGKLHQVVSFLQKNRSRNLTGFLEKLDEAQEMIHRLIRRIQDSPASEEEAVQALLQDLEGQVTQALSKEEWYNKWGRHYLPSLAGAHRLQLCNNFKDPGVQGYGGKVFDNLRDEADDLFVSLPPPKPSSPQRSSGGGAAAPVSMAAYHNCGGG